MHDLTRTLRREPFLGQVPEPQAALPAFRVAVFGLSTTLLRVLQIVLEHARHNPYRFVVHAPAADDDFDVALVDVTQQGGLQRARALRQGGAVDRVLTVGRRTHHARRPDDVPVHRFAVSLLGALNALIARRLETLAAPAPTRGQRSAAWMRPHALESFLGRRPRVLVLEPVWAAQQRVAHALLADGWEVAPVTTPRAARQAWQGQSLDVLWFAAQLGAQSGFALAREYKRAQRGPRVPVLVHNAQPRRFDLLRAMGSGCDGYVVAALSQEALQQAADRCLRRGLIAQPEQAWMLAPRG